MREKILTPCRNSGTKFKSNLHSSSKQNEWFSFNFSKDVDNDHDIKAGHEWEGVYGHLNYYSWGRSKIQTAWYDDNERNKLLSFLISERAVLQNVGSVAGWYYTIEE